ncbi:MAG: GT2 family glycosyltransferase/cephalosporin hydroxylase [Candidatus Nitrosomirales archaeon]|jgi:GT2 family glycosyltransferase/cephalosporin hydroxylase
MSSAVDSELQNGKYKRHKKNLARIIASALREESIECTSISDYVDLAYSFTCSEHSIRPLQVRSEIHILLEILAKYKPKTLLEIGTANGGTLFLFCNVADPEAMILGIDMPHGNFGGEFYPDWKIPFYESFATNKQRIHLIRADSHDIISLEKVTRILGQRRLDLLFIDGDHSYDGVKRDFEMYSSLAAEGCIIAFHDINPGPKEEVGDVPRFWNEIKRKYPHLEIVDGTRSAGIGLLFLESHISRSIEVSRTILEFKRKQIENNPLGLLLAIYSERPDLQNAFPEVLEGNYTRLLKWADDVSRGLTNECSLDKLLKFSSWYSNNELTRHKQQLDAANNELISYKRELDVINNELTRHKQQLDAANNELISYKRELGLANNELAKYRKHLDITKNELANHKQELDAIRSSSTFKFMKFCSNRIDRMLPEGSRGGEFRKIAVKSLHIITTQGFRSLLLQAIERIKHREFTLVEPTLQLRPTHKHNSNIQNLCIKIDNLSKEDIKIINKKISIVIPTKNPDQDFEVALEKLKEQEGFKEIEIIVVDSGSTEVTLELARKYANVISIKPEQFNHGLTRNLAAEKASGDYILFTVQDAMPIGRLWLYSMVKVLESDPQIAAVTVRQIPKSNADLFACFSLWFHYKALNLYEDKISLSNQETFDDLSPIEKRRLVGLDDVCCLVRKEVFDKLKFSDIEYAEDLDLGLRIMKNGYKIAFLHSVGVIHSHNMNPAYFLRRSYTDSKMLPRVLSYEPTYYKTDCNINEMLSAIVTLYAALNAAVEFMKPLSFDENAASLIAKVKSLISENLQNHSSRLIQFERSGNHLDHIFDEISKVCSKSDGKMNHVVLQQYCDRLNDFKTYLAIYDSLKDKKAEFLEALYKLFATLVGSTLANYYMFKSKDEISKELGYVDSVLSRVA